MTTSVHDYRHATRELIVALGRMIRAFSRHPECPHWQMLFEQLAICLRHERWGRAQNLAFQLNMSMSRIMYRSYESRLMNSAYEAACWLFSDLDWCELPTTDLTAATGYDIMKLHKPHRGAK